jgi:hypothetical protein
MARIQQRRQRSRKEQRLEVRINSVDVPHGHFGKTIGGRKGYRRGCNECVGKAIRN